MRRKSRVLSIAAASGLAVAGLAVAAPLGASANSTACSPTSPNYYGTTTPIMTSPISLSLWTAANEPWYGTAGAQFAVCYSVPDPVTGKELTGGSLGSNILPVYPGGGGVGVGNDPDTSAEVQSLDGVGYSSGITITPGGAAGDTVTTSIGFAYCAGANLNVGESCGGNLNNPATVGATGLIIDNLGLSGAPCTGCQGATAAPQGTIYIDGVLQEPFSNIVGAGVNSAAANAGTSGPGIPICIGSCVTLPGVWAGTDGAPIGTIVVGQTPITIPSTSPTPQCYSVGAACPTPY